jgi:hypothetical protein
MELMTMIVHFFSSVAHVWVPGAKTTGPNSEKVWFILNLIFFGSEKFQVLAHAVLTK